VVLLDNSDPQRLDRLANALRATAALKVCIDHHPDPDSCWDVLLVRLDAPCTGFLVHEVFKAAGAPLDAESADALYAALASDTGRFRFGNTTAAAFRAATELVEAGADPAGVYAQLSERLSAGFLLLTGDLLAGMELRRDGRLILLRARAELLERRGAHGEDLSEVLNQALKLRTGRVAALFRETRPGVTKVSLRSKGQLDVNRLARRHGGGGHRNASGIVLQVGLEDAVARLLPDLEQLAQEQ
jgi:phosphoesterase RecJ-like protein